MLCKKRFLKISPILHENTCPRVSFLIAGLHSPEIIKPWYWCFLVNFAKFLRKSFWRNTSGQLLLKNVILQSCDVGFTLSKVAFAVTIWPSWRGMCPKEFFKTEIYRFRYKMLLLNIYFDNFLITKKVAMSKGISRLLCI